MTVFRYIDVVLMVVAAPILLLIGVPAAGYGVAAGAWLALRVVEIGVNRYVAAVGDVRRELTLRLAFMLVRIFLLALAVVLVRRGIGKDDALTALLLIVCVFTIHMATSFGDRPPRS